MKSLYYFAVVSLCTVSIASAATNLINADFNAVDAETTTQYTQSGAAVLGAAGDQWTGILLPSSSLGDTALKFSDGTTSAITIGISSYDLTVATNTDSEMFFSEAYRSLYRDLAALDEGSPSVTISLKGFVPNSNVASIILYAGNGNDLSSTFIIGSETRVATDSSYVGDPLEENLNYVRFRNVQANGSGEISITWADTTGNFRPAILNGIQIELTVADPFGTWATNLNVTGGKEGDDDQDGATNLMEFATAGDPKNGDSGARVYPLIHQVGGQDVLTYTVAVRPGATFAANGVKQQADKDVVRYTVEGSNDLVTWDAVIVTELSSGDASSVQAALGEKLNGLDSAWEWHTFRTDGGIPGDPSDFIRLKVTETP